MPTKHDAKLEIELNPKERTFYDRLRHSVFDRFDRDGVGLRDILFLLPDIGVLLLRLLKDKRVPRKKKWVALLGVGYWISPIDFFPAWIFGPIGFLDDLLILFAAVSSIVNHVHPDVLRSHWPGQGAVLTVVCRLSAWSERKIWRRLRRFL